MTRRDHVAAMVVAFVMVGLAVSALLAFGWWLIEHQLESDGWQLIQMSLWISAISGLAIGLASAPRPPKTSRHPVLRVVGEEKARPDATGTGLPPIA